MSQPQQVTQAEIEAWVQTKATGKFHYTKVMDGLVGRELYPVLRTIMHRCKEKGIAYPVDGRDGWWRPADNRIEELCWWDGDGETIGENILFPLGINNYCYVPKPSLVIVAGKYNTGKTAFCINVVNLNLEKWENKIDFYVSEGAEMMKAKFQNINSFIPKPPPFKMYRRTENFADIINPDHLSVIDYLRVDMSKPYEVGSALFAIFNKVNGGSGIAVVAMQKPPGERKLAFGGASTAFEPTLYIGMDKDTLGFEKVKVPKITNIDPYSLKIQFKISKGVNFYEVHEVFE